MKIIIEKLSTLNNVKSVREIKLPKGRLLITIGETKIIVTNDEPKESKKINS
jgi:ribonuclease PH